MALDELYPYWEDVHQDFVDLLVFVPDEQLDAKQDHEARSIKQIVLHFVNEERFWIGHLVAQHPFERVNASDCTTVELLIDALKATREATRRVIGLTSPEGLRTVRAVPADPETNRPETNAPVSWLIWHVLETEIICLGQIKQRLEDSKNA
jgi:uncharacterized damage-inducible protein DinB